MKEILRIFYKKIGLMEIVKLTLSNLNDMIIHILVQNNTFEFSKKPNYFWRHAQSFNNKKIYAFSNIIGSYLISFSSCVQPILWANSYKFIITLNLVDGWVVNNEKLEIKNWSQRHIYDPAANLWWIVFRK